MLGHWYAIISRKKKNKHTFLILKTLVGLLVCEPQHPMVCVNTIIKTIRSRLVWQACLHLVLTQVQTSLVPRLLPVFQCCTLKTGEPGRQNHMSVIT